MGLVCWQPGGEDAGGAVGLVARPKVGTSRSGLSSLELVFAAPPACNYWPFWKVTTQGRHPECLWYHKSSQKGRRVSSVVHGPPW